MNFSLSFLSEAHTYFVEYISKAYQALTDPVSRENFEKYGHPDGRQVVLLFTLNYNLHMKKFFCHICVPWSRDVDLFEHLALN